MRVRKLIKAMTFAILQAFLWIVMPLYGFSEGLALIENLEPSIRELVNNLLITNLAKMTSAFIIAGIMLIIASILKSYFENYEIQNLIGKLLSYFAGFYIATTILSFGNFSRFGLIDIISGSQNIGIKLILNLQLFVFLLFIVLILKSIVALLQYSVSREEIAVKGKIAVL